MISLFPTLLTALVVSCACLGCSEEHSPASGGNKPIAPLHPQNNSAVSENNAMSKEFLVVSTQTDETLPQRVGIITFDEKNQPTLKTEGDATQAKQLESDWAEVRSKGELIWKTSEPDEKDGETIMRIVGVKVSPGDANYIYAVLDTLQRKYGYNVDISE